MIPERIKCFVAMALGRKDCDKIYFGKIEPVLSRLNLNTIRVDLCQHDDDLNSRIIRELKNADIVLVDLTYARPSVYYEAGFAERSVPVAYTVRKDHLGRGKSDEWRVHFDLSMKKIIEWSSPSDGTFQKRLRGRLKYLLAPIVRKREEDQSFQSLSVAQRCQTICDCFTKRLKAKRFFCKPLFDVDRDVSRRLGTAKTIIAAKRFGCTAISATVMAAQSITLNQIKTVLANGQEVIEDSDISKFEQHIFFCSLSRLPSSKFTAACPHAIPGKLPNCFQLIQKATECRKQSKTTIWLLAEVSSERQVSKLAKEYISPITKQKTNTFTTILTPPASGRGYITFHKKK